MKDILSTVIKKINLNYSFIYGITFLIFFQTYYIYHSSRIDRYQTAINTKIETEKKLKDLLEAEDHDELLIEAYKNIIKTEQKYIDNLSYLESLNVPIINNKISPMDFVDILGLILVILYIVNLNLLKKIEFIGKTKKGNLEKIDILPITCYSIKKDDIQVNKFKIYLPIFVLVFSLFHIENESLFYPQEDYFPYKPIIKTLILTVLYIILIFWISKTHIKKYNQILSTLNTQRD